MTQPNPQAAAEKPAKLTFDDMEKIKGAVGRTWLDYGDSIKDAEGRAEYFRGEAKRYRDYAYLHRDKADSEKDFRRAAQKRDNFVIGGLLAMNTITAILYATLRIWG